MNYIEALGRTAKKLDAEFESSELINHSPSKGAFREYIIKQCIRPFLPEAYGISGGECFDIDGNVSKQLDAVVYDRLYSYIVPYSDDFIQFPYESVYGNIEVKSFLNKEELFASIDNIESFKKLKRDTPTGVQIVPNRSIDIKGIKWSDTGPKETFGVVFAYDSIKPETLIEYLRTIDPDRMPYLPNMFVLYKHKTLIVRIEYGEGDEINKLYPNFYGNYDGFMTLPCGEYTLPIFITNILIHSSCEHLTTMSITDLINPIIDDALRNMGTQKVARYKYGKNTIVYV